MWKKEEKSRRGRTEEHGPTWETLPINHYSSHSMVKALFRALDSAGLVHSIGGIRELSPSQSWTFYSFFSNMSSRPWATLGWKSFACEAIWILRVCAERFVTDFPLLLSHQQPGELWDCGGTERPAAHITIFGIRSCKWPRQEWSPVEFSGSTYHYLAGPCHQRCLVGNLPNQFEIRSLL